MPDGNHVRPEDLQKLVARSETDAGTPEPATQGSNAGFESAAPRPIHESEATQKALAIGVTVGFFGLLLLLCFEPAPKGNEAMLNIVLGSLATAWVSVMSYYFGSALGSKAKDQLLYNSRPAAPSDK